MSASKFLSNALAVQARPELTKVNSEMATVMVQRFINVVAKRNLLIDGFWGEKTQLAYSTLSPSSQSEISVLLKRAFGPAYNPDSLYKSFLSVNRAKPYVRMAGGNFISSIEIDSIINQVGADYPDVPGKAIKLMLNLESGNGKGFMNAHAVGPRNAKSGNSPLGLGQFFAGAWRDARSVDSALPAFSKEAAFDPSNSVRAIFAYSRYNKSRLIADGYRKPVGVFEFYLMHNQGLKGAQRYLAGDVSSVAANDQRAITKARNA